VHNRTCTQLTCDLAVSVGSVGSVELVVAACHRIRVSLANDWNYNNANRVKFVWNKM